MGRRSRFEARTEVAADVATFGAPGRLATILVGDDPASHVYVGSKHKALARGGNRVA